MAWSKKTKESQHEWLTKNHPDVMVDLETLGTDTDCVVLSLGAVRFRMGVQDDIRTIEDPRRSFFARLDDEEQRQRGRSQDLDTLDWWGDQSSAAQAVLFAEGEPVAGVLQRFSVFCQGAKRIWGNGNMFDNAIIRSLYDEYNQDYPVEYYQDLDQRTLKWIWNFGTNWGSKGKAPTFVVGVKHNALDDAKTQVLQVQKMLLELIGSKYES